jgi:hypothetical protein
LDITYKSRKLEKICEDKKVSVKSYGIDMANKIKLRINEIRASDSVEEMIQYQIGRCHALVGDRFGEYAVDLVQPFRLIFIKDDDTKQIKVVKIMEIIDYHK